MLSNKKGITLFELMVVMALFMIVIGVGFSLLISGNNYFTRSKLRSDIQYEVRMVSDFIRDDLRNAVDVELLASIPDPLDGVSEYVIIEDSIIKHIDTSGNYKDKVTFNMIANFEIKTVNTSTILVINIEGTDASKFGTKSYEVTTEVILNNIRYYDQTATGQVIRYKKP